MTSSNTLRTYSTARFFLDDEIVRRFVHGVTGRLRSLRDAGYTLAYSLIRLLMHTWT